MAESAITEFSKREIRPHDDLIIDIRRLLASNENIFKEHLYSYSIAEKEASKGKSFSLVLAEDTGIELGPPTKKSVSLFLWTFDKNLIPEGIRIAAPEVSDLKGRPVSYAQIVMAEMLPEADPFDTRARNLMGLANRMAGCMTRVLQGRIWIRVHRDLAEAGFSLSDISEELVSVYREKASDSIGRLGVLIIADNDEIIAQIEKVQAMARLVNGENRKLQIEEDGSLSCDDLACGSCSEKTYCDMLREVIKLRRRSK